MNKYFLTFILLLLACINKNNAQEINIDSIELHLSYSIVHNNSNQKINNDTTIINYSIAHGELGCTNEGLIIYNESNVLKAKFVRYNVSSYGIPWKADTIINFYKKNRDNYTVLRQEWVLDSQQINYVTNLLVEIKNFSPKCCSNASEHYVILTHNQSWIKIDAVGQWNKFLEIKKVLGVEQCPKKL